MVSPTLPKRVVAAFSVDQPNSSPPFGSRAAILGKKVCPVLPIFSPFNVSKHSQLYAALKKAGPDQAWNMMRELRHLDEKARADEHREGLDFLRGKCLEAFKVTTEVGDAQAKLEAERFSRYPSEVQFDAVYLLLWFCDPERLSEAVAIEGIEHLDEARRFGKGVLLVPFHVGPATATVGIVAHHIKVTALLRKLPFEELRSVFFPELDFQHCVLEEVDVVRSALDVLRRGECFSMFPEYDPRREVRDQSHMDVPFFGARVRAPIGPAGISKIAKAPIVPVSGRSLGGGKYVVKYHPVIAPPVKPEDREVVTLEIWDTLKRDLLERGLGDWEMWMEFEHMAVGSDV